MCDVKDAIGKIEKLSLKKGDIVTVELKTRLQSADMELLMIKLQRQFKSNEVVLLCEGVEVKVKKEVKKINLGLGGEKYLAI